MPESEVSERRRQATVMKKANELSILCSADVAVISFTSDGKLHEYSNNSVEHIISRYKNYKGGLVLPTKMESDLPEESRRETAPANEEETESSDKVLNELKGQHAALKLDKLRRTGKALDSLSREELYALEQQQKWALVSVLKKKEELLVRLLQRSKLRERQAIQEKEILERGSEERTKGITYLQLFPENSSGFGECSKAVSLLNRPTQDMDCGFRLSVNLGHNHT